MSTRMLMLKIAATLATMIAGGCQQLLPGPETKPQQVEVVVKVQDGKLTVNDATINVESKSKATELCPCCGATGACQGLCGKAGCVCSRGEASAVPTVGNVAAVPQYSTRMEWQCRGGVCGWWPVEVISPLATAAKRPVAPMTHGGQITIYDNGSPAGKAMRDAIGSKGVEWKRGDPPVAIGGVRWSPTAIKPNGAAWTPGAGGWHSQSLMQFQTWASQ